MTVSCTFDDFCSALDKEIFYPTEIIKVCAIYFAWHYYCQCEEEYDLAQIIEIEKKNINKATRKMREMYGIDLNPDP